MLLLAGLVALAMLAALAPRRITLPRSPLGAALCLCVACAFAVMCAGSFVSSSGAGLACTTLPACDGGSILGSTAAQTAQMLHRLLAGVLAAAVVWAGWLAVTSAGTRLRTAIAAAGALLVAQIGLGAANVAWLLPTLLREAHAANACALYLTLIGATMLAAIDGTQRAGVREHVRPSAANAELAR
jgi:heme A synthase